MDSTLQALRSFALGFPEAREGVACEGTVLEKRTIQAGPKAFLFLGVGDVMLKLRASLGEAVALAAAEPTRYKVGAHGWVTARLDDGVVPRERLERWIDESYRTLATKALVARIGR